LTKLFDFERNQPCPCGSDKKYKRCCLPAVDTLYRFWRQWDGGWLAPAFAQALAACGGLKPDEDEVLPERAALEAALRDLRAALSGDHARRGEALTSKPAALERLLEDDEHFRHLRLDTGEVDDLLTRLDAAVPPDEQAVAEHAWARETIEAWLASQGGRGKQSMIIALWQGLRRRSYPPAELTALLLALNLEIMDFPAEENPFWFLVAWTSVRETLRLQEELEELIERMRASEPGDDATVKEFRALLEQYPILERRLVRNLLMISGPVLGRLADGTIPLSVPAYALFDGLWCSVAYVARTAGGKGSSAGAGPELGKAVLTRLERKEKDPEYGLLLAESAWVRDYDLFTPAFRALLDRWLEGPGRELAEADREAVRTFGDFFGDLTLMQAAKIYLMVYVLALVEATRRGQAALVVPGDDDGPGLSFIDCFTPEGAARYAAYLESKGQTAAAAHVRDVAKSR